MASVPTLLNADLLKVGHHGAASSTTEAFLAAVDPEVAVISASADNSYGHPSPKVLDRLQEIGCMIYRTDRQGTLIFLCDGTNLTRYMD